MRSRAPHSPMQASDRLEAGLEVDTLATLMTGMYAGGVPASTISTHPDAALARSIQQAHSRIAPGRIRSRVEHGWAILEGEVDCPATRQEAARAALRVDGIQGVSNRLRLSHGPV